MIRTKTDTGPLHRGGRYLSFAGNIALWLVVAAAFVLLWPSALGGQSTFVIVAGHSMEPSYLPGDLVYARAGTPAVGDVVIYVPDGYPHSRVVHQIVGGDGVTGWDVKGINNSWHDPWAPTNADVVGIVRARIPDAGLVTKILLSPVPWICIIIVALGLLAWPEPTTEASEAEPPEATPAPAPAGSARARPRAASAPSRRPSSRDVVR